MLYPDNKIQKYIEEHSTGEDELLALLNRKTHLDVLNPRMLSGPVQGKLLEMISRMIRPEYVLEIGTYTGYSAICLAKGIQKGGKLITIEIVDELQEMIEEFIEKADLTDTIELITGNACNIIPSLNYSFDLIFIDADKKQYKEYYELALTKLNTGGFILADNVLWSGKVTEEIKHKDEETKCIADFNRHVQKDPRVENLILPVRDGLSVIRKK